MKIIIAILLGLLSFNAFSSTPVCYSTHGGYCQYNGKVNRIYINSGNLILIYFETAISVEDAEIAGITITKGSAAAFRVTENPDFANLFYSTALAAQASGRNISIQMRGNESGYLKFDRIWLNK